jgi:Putative MetA-pathway of phenol degradation
MLRLSNLHIRRSAPIVLLLVVFASGTRAQSGEKQREQPSATPPQLQQTPDSQPDQAQSSDELKAVPNRPTFASTAEMIPRGVFEVEYGFEGGDGHQNINGLLKFGLVKNLELWFLNNPIQRDAGVTGFADSGAGFKFKLFAQQGPRPAVSTLYVATLPTATHGLGGDAVSHLFQLLVSKDFGKHHFDVNEGIKLVGIPDASGFDRSYFTALSYSHPIQGKWGFTAEVSGFSRVNKVTGATMTILGAPTYNLKSRLVLDAGAYVAVYGNLPRVTAFIGLTYSIGNLYQPRSRSPITQH